MTATWFPTQAQAFTERLEREASGEKAHVWAQECGAGGKRRYLCGTLQQMWNVMMRQTAREHRHFYELIYGDVPVRLYLDIEVHCGVQPAGCDWHDVAYCDARMVELFDCVRRLLARLYGDEVASRASFVQADSSNERKFSRHVVMHGDGLLFESNVHVGRFVDLLVERGTLSDSLFVFNPSAPDDTNATIVDPAVYTRNRCFRFPGNCKLGSERFLEPYGDGERRVESLDDLRRHMVAQTLEEEEAPLLRVEDEQTAQRSRELPMRLVPRDMTTAPTSRAARARTRLATVAKTHWDEAVARRMRDIAYAIASALNTDAYVQYRIDTHMMTCSDSTDRVCHRAGRRHKHNHICWVVRLYTDRRNGADSGTRWQKCLDPNCADVPLPQQHRLQRLEHVEPRTKALVAEYGQLVRTHGERVSGDDMQWLLS